MRLLRWFSVVRLRLRSLFRGRLVDRELDEELDEHVRQQTEANLAAGMPPDLARTAALRALSGIERVKEECRDHRGLSIVEHVARDVGLALRQLARQPVFAAAAILSLALGIGANTAIFQWLDALTLRALPVSAPHELVEIRLAGGGRLGRHTGRNRQLSYPQWIELERRQAAFSSMLAFGDTRFNLAPSGEVRYVEGLWVSGSFFETLGVRPAVGRLIAISDDRPGCGFPGAVISHALWQRDFGGRADIVGQTIPFGANRVPILGVTPPGFFGVEVGRHFDVALPLCSSGFERRDHWWLATFGRLKPGWTRQQAQAHLDGVMAGVQRDTLPATYRADEAAVFAALRVEVRDARTGVSPLRESYARPLVVLMAIAALVLFITSVNLANLLLARAVAREPEFALRLALGGSRGRVVQQVLTECLLLAALGALAALGVARLVSGSLVPLLSTAVDPVFLALSLDWRVFGLTAMVAVATTLVFGTAPAVAASRVPALRTATRGATAAAPALALRRGLVAAQIAVTLALVAASLVLVRSFRNLATEDLGVVTDGVVIANVFFPEASYPPEKRVLAYGDLEQRLRALPGVTGLAEAFTTPIGGSFSDRQVRVDGGLAGSTNVNRVSAGYFDTLGTPLVAGRDFDGRDTPGSPRVAIVNEAFAAAYLGGAPLGRRLGTVNAANEPDTEYEVVGVVRNQKYLDIREPFPPILYPASSQEPPGLTRRYVIRSTEPLPRTTSAISALLTEADSAIGVRYAGFSTQVSDALLQDRLTARLAGLFGLVALLLASVGLYGVVSYSVTSRRAEIGVRMALGATRGRILAMILGDVGRVLAAGLAAGAVLTFFATRAIGSLLYGVDPHDPALLTTSAAILAAAGVLAAAWPARRAATADPLATLRES
jgi:predicted permease